MLVLLHKTYKNTGTGLDKNLCDKINPVQKKECRYRKLQTTTKLGLQTSVSKNTIFSLFLTSFLSLFLPIFGCLFLSRSFSSLFHTLIFFFNPSYPFLSLKFCFTDQCSLLFSCLCFFCKYDCLSLFILKFGCFSFYFSLCPSFFMFVGQYIMCSVG